MAREIVVTHLGGESRFTFSKLSREQLYGKRQRLGLDPTGENCQRAQLTDDGALLLVRGMLGQGYFDSANGYVETANLIGIAADGSSVERQAATLNVAQALSEPVEVEEVLDLHVTTVYRLQGEELNSELEQSLEQGAIYRFPLNYQADFHVETAYILKNDQGIFVLVGTPATTEWVEPAVTVDELFESEETGIEEIDFDMM